MSDTEKQEEAEYSAVSEEEFKEDLGLDVTILSERNS